MRESRYKDETGRKFAVWLPDGMPESEARLGIHIGPHDISELGLPEDISVRLHNELFDRRIFTSKDARARKAELVGAVMSACKATAERIQEIYIAQEDAWDEQAKQEVKNEPKDNEPPRRTAQTTKTRRSGDGRRTKVNA